MFWRVNGWSPFVFLTLRSPHHSNRPLQGLHFDTSVEEVRRQYRKVSLMVHPDKCKHPRAKDAFEVVGNAQKELMDEEKRKHIIYLLNYAKGGVGGWVGGRQAGRGWGGAGRAGGGWVVGRGGGGGSWEAAVVIGAVAAGLMLPQYATCFLE